MHNAFELAAGRPWLMLPEHLDTLLAVADRMGNPEALEARLGRELDNTRTVIQRGDVAVIPVTGPIFRYANLFTRISGATSTQVLATDLQAALDNPRIRSIVLNIDSPGGEANGINELAEMVYAARSQKKVVAYIGGNGASAAYWIASAASEVVIDDIGIAGSIGAALEVVVREPDASGKRYEIVSRNAPNKRPDLTTEEGRSQIGETIDDLGDVFAAKVARNLGVKPEDVPAMGNHGGLKVGAKAVAAGLAHRLGSLESVIAELAGPASPQPRKLTMTTVTNTAELRAAIEAGVDPLTIQIAGPDLAAERSAAVSAERERIAGIHALASAGFEAEISAAIEAGTSVEATALTLVKAAQDRGISLTSIKKDATPSNHAIPPAGDNAEKERASAVSSIVAGAKARR
ncbi:S49 family peptidase [Metapseudomonas otitidis]|uniref:S49 family peptidase n=1 Tax=Metapseudomonas otitidis TaxID=319939 RepID=UPI00260BEBDE|nr:S49 family peptidase [Pseudomonas otitidis]